MKKTRNEIHEELAQEQRLIAANKRRLRILQVQRATEGSQTAPHIVMEIEDLEQQISAQKRKITRLQAEANPARLPRPTKALHQVVEPMEKTHTAHSDDSTRSDPDSLEQAVGNSASHVLDKNSALPDPHPAQVTDRMPVAPVATTPIRSPVPAEATPLSPVPKYSPPMPSDVNAWIFNLTLLGILALAIYLGIQYRRIPPLACVPPVLGGLTFSVMSLAGIYLLWLAWSLTGRSRGIDRAEPTGVPRIEIERLLPRSLSTPRILLLAILFGAMSGALVMPASPFRRIDDPAPFIESFFVQYLDDPSLSKSRNLRPGQVLELSLYQNVRVTPVFRGHINARCDWSTLDGRLIRGEGCSRLLSGLSFQSEDRVIVYHASECATEDAWSGLPVKIVPALPES
jgi:hypothetical protein